MRIGVRARAGDAAEAQVGNLRRHGGDSRLGRVLPRACARLLSACSPFPVRSRASPRRGALGQDRLRGQLR